MPELPEVETTRRGIDPHVVGRTIERLTVRDGRLRWPVEPALPRKLAGLRIASTSRRGKYLLLDLGRGTLVIHLGMSGSLRVLRKDEPPRSHDHVDLVLEGGTLLRYRDPRRFGCWLYTEGDPLELPLLAHLGPEPLSAAFDGGHLFRVSRRKIVSVKNLVMDASIVAGVGNIYANEALFMAGVSPHRKAGRVTRAAYDRLAAAIREVLALSIRRGGTTLRDFVGGEGEPGYFAQELRVYEREGEPCKACGATIKLSRREPRSTYHCPRCQR